ncbi:unnamed protein product [Linum tenue]|uniref:DUF599 domain-containing protein n=1 Tax=Linum tenue TaxID=586396 RepID=A0AAV0KN69_9ROSI|nr:unnamed protein product [Linum tenue]
MFPPTPAIKLIKLPCFCVYIKIRVLASRRQLIVNHKLCPAKIFSQGKEKRSMEESNSRTSLHEMETLLVPLSVFVMVGYHAYLWHYVKTKPFLTTQGTHAIMRKQWLLAIKQGDEKKEMLAVQSLRNGQMATILCGTVAIMINVALPALTNNTYTTGRHLSLMRSPLFGSHQSGGITVLKYGSASVCLLASFLCSSMGLGFLMDANFLLVNAAGNYRSGCGGAEEEEEEHTERLVERGFKLGILGNRVLCISLPLLAWLLGPVAMAVSTLALVWILYCLDFRSQMR